MAAKARLHGGTQARDLTNGQRDPLKNAFGLLKWRQLTSRLAPTVQKKPNINVSSRFIRGIPVKTICDTSLPSLVSGACIRDSKPSARWENGLANGRLLSGE
jgi:hypothetical protein